MISYPQDNNTYTVFSQNHAFFVLLFLLQEVMKIEPMNYCALLDGLINKDQVFLLYREPHSLHPNLAVVPASSIEYLEQTEHLNGKTGYVFAPFEPNEEHPLVLLENYTRYTGYASISTFLEKQAAQAIEAENCPERVMVGHSATTLEKNHYKKAFKAIHAAVVEGDCQKVVLSRNCLIERPAHFSPAGLFEAACSNYPEAYVYLFHSPVTGTWFGSTPEALLMGDGENWQTVAVAGTKQLNDTTDVVWDEKNRLEQQIVTDYVEHTLGSFGIQTEKSGPYPTRTGQLVHLKTQFQFNLPKAMHDQLGTLIGTLHPTPATCGFPKEQAMELIRRHEQHDRSYYCGFLGSLLENGTTQLYVNLRCMNITPAGLVLYAGGGIMPDSTCESEWEETESKLQTLLSLLA